MAMTSVSKRQLDDYLGNSKTAKHIGEVGPGSYEPHPFEKEAAYK